jgi:hypothetical protein
MHALNGLRMLGLRNDPVGDMNPPNHEYAVLLLYLADNISYQARFLGPDPARLQRASEGTE